MTRRTLKMFSHDSHGTSIPNAQGLSIVYERWIEARVGHEKGVVWARGVRWMVSEGVRGGGDFDPRDLPRDGESLPPCPLQC